jgi:hypothetical protein
MSLPVIIKRKASIPLTSLTVSHLARRTCLWTIVKLVTGILAFLLMITGKRHVRRGKCDTVKLVNGILAFPLMITGRDMYDVVNVTRLNWLMPD